MSRGGTGYGQETGHPAGDLGILLAGFILGYHKDFAPIPPTPFPSGEGGDFILYFAGG